MGATIAPVAGSGSWPTWMALVAKPICISFCCPTAQSLDFCTISILRHKNCAANHSAFGSSRKFGRHDQDSVPVLPAEQILEKVAAANPVSQLPALLGFQVSRIS